jgi:RNA-directed DNA polymerase
MHYAFDSWLEREFPAVEFERYADDAVVHCATERQAREVLAALAERMEEVGLRLHPDKTKIVYCKDSRRRGSYEHTAFTFLGYTFRPRKARYPDGKAFTSFLPAVSAEVLKAMGRRVRSWRIHMRIRGDLDELAEWINPIVAGWMNYYGRFYRSELSATHQYLPGALGAEEIQEVALLQTPQGMVDRTPRSRARPVQALGMGETVQLERMRRAE